MAQVVQLYVRLAIRILSSLLHQYFNHDKEGEDENEQWNLLFQKENSLCSIFHFYLKKNMFYILQKKKKLSMARLSTIIM